MPSFWDQFPNSQADPRVGRTREAVLQQMMSEVQNPAKQTQFPQGMSDQQAQRTQRGLQERRTFGDLMQASGDKALSPLGKSMSKADPVKFQQDRERQEQVRRYQQWQADNSGKDRLTSLTKSMEALTEAGGEGELWRKMPAGRLGEMQFDRAQSRNLSRFMGTVAPRFTQQFGKWLGTQGITGPIENLSRWIARNGIAGVPDELKEQAQWWSDLESEVVASWRHELFGATLTNNEQSAFRNLAMLEPSMPAEEVAKRLNNLHAARIEGARERVQFDIMNYGGKNPGGMIRHLKRIWGQDLDTNVQRSYTTGSSPQSGMGGITIQRAGQAAAAAQAPTGNVSPGGSIPFGTGQIKVLKP